ncbi:hypothetical protein I3842_14G094900 [Carya illinoinensis]|uniref:Fungal lipase-type domain-containing protein n=1 Tax=Carya illinoinensis TaxID=32201 RepID=A0A922AJ66_CARIL|nr:hypothetical protein I3842_14G094900 [Carya illinoinensis]
MKNIDHQRSIVVGLVQGVYSLEMDHERKNLGSYPEDNAEPWWTSFNFHLDERLIDDDKCIFDAICKYNGKYASGDFDAPEYVIAFRGTLLMPETMRNDITLDFKCFFHKLEESSHFKLALNHVEHLVKANRDRNVWLAGHSLGSAIALLVGKKMILNMKWYPKAYLFNPPFLSFVPSSIKMLENEKVKTGILGVRHMLRAGLTLAAEPRNLARMEEHLALLSPWTPHMFVNPADIFCVAYIDYFKSKDGAREIMKLAENNSIRNLVNHVVFQTDSKHATHILPSAHLIDFFEAHTISQWWCPSVRCQSTLYQHQH